jgi:hypothetical protein
MVRAFQGFIRGPRGLFHVCGGRARRRRAAKAVAAASGLRARERVMTPRRPAPRPPLPRTADGHQAVRQMVMAAPRRAARASRAAGGARMQPGPSCGPRRRRRRRPQRGRTPPQLLPFFPRRRARWRGASDADASQQQPAALPGALMAAPRPLGRPPQFGPSRGHPSRSMRIARSARQHAAARARAHARRWRPPLGRPRWRALGSPLPLAPWHAPVHHPVTCPSPVKATPVTHPITAPSTPRPKPSRPKPSADQRRPCCHAGRSARGPAPGPCALLAHLAWRGQRAAAWRALPPAAAPASPGPLPHLPPGNGSASPFLPAPAPPAASPGVARGTPAMWRPRRGGLPQRGRPSLPFSGRGAPGRAPPPLLSPLPFQRHGCPGRCVEPGRGASLPAPSKQQQHTPHSPLNRSFFFRRPPAARRAVLLSPCVSMPHAPTRAPGGRPCAPPGPAAPGVAPL